MGKTILDYVKRNAELYSDKVAVKCHEGDITYSELYDRMAKCMPLPLPLLGESWDGDFVLYTTGSTGKPKGVMISQRAVIANSENLIGGHGYTEKTVMVITGAMDHLGCWSKIFPTLMVGGTLLILKDAMRDVEAFMQAMASAECTATFLVPSNIRVLLQQTGERLSEYADKIDFIETGAAPMPHSDMLRLCELLPRTRLYNTYASTETGVVATYNYNDGRCMEGCLGKPLKHSHVIITEQGTIACKGDMLMSGYKDAPELTAEVLRDGTVYTADNGYLDDEGMLHIQGRTDDIINTGGFKVAPQEVENVAMGHPVVKDCICVAHSHPILGKAPELLVVLNENCKLNKRELALYISEKLERYKVPIYYKEVSDIERTSNGKLNRKAYRV